ncbi:hypothetical protein ACP4OV_029012 [Aristida adscensionis]
MCIAVVKFLPVLVGPSKLTAQTTTEKFILSSFDCSLAGISATSLLVFDQPIKEPIETIKRAMSQALVHYYPIAGRLCIPENDNELPIIACTGEGVFFWGASAKCTLESVNFSSPTSLKELLKDLAVYVPSGGWRHTDPLLLMQVTEFLCGGFVIGVTWNHAIADGIGMAQFLQAIGELVRGLSTLSVAPIRIDELLAVLSPSSVEAKQLAMGIDESDFACFEISVQPSLASSIKVDLNSNSSGEPNTMFEVVSAMLWQCRTRAVISNHNAPAPLIFAANMRKHVGAKDGYYGNCIIPVVVLATSGAVAGSSIKELVNLIKSAKERIPDMYNDSEIDILRGLDLEQLSMVIGYNAFYVSSWVNLGFDMADFGSGRPARVMSHMEANVPMCVPCPPCKGKDEVNVFCRCVKEEHVNSFVGELSRFK